MTRALAAALAAVLAGCPSQEDGVCPGTTVGVFDLQAECLVVETTCDVEPAAGWASLVPAFIPDAPKLDAAGAPVERALSCAELEGSGLRPGGTFPATLSGAPGGGTIALCTGRRLSVDLTGTRSGDAVQVSATTDGAVVGACAATCAATLTVTVQGALLPAAGGAPLRFEGTLVERLDAADGADCGGCVLPCRSTYRLTGNAR